MPDGLTHVIAGYIGISRWVKAGRLTFFLAGSVMPDIFVRGGRLLFFFHPDRDFFELYLVPLHTPFTSLFICLALAQLFHSETKKTAFLYLYLGCMAHFILDFFQRTISGFGLTKEVLEAYHWLYPFGFFDFQFGLVWPEHTPYALFILMPLASCIFYKRKKRARFKPNQ